jgi:hypothetical protein
MKITKQQFLEAMQAIKDQYDKDRLWTKKAGALFPDAFEANLLYDNETVKNGFISLLKALTRDDGNTIEYFIYERNWGEEGDDVCVIDNVRGVSWTLNNVEELYNYLKFYY